MLKQFLRLTGLLWLSLLLSLFALHSLGAEWKAPFIAYLSQAERDTDIVLADSASGLNLRMTANRNREEELSWSPDGRYLYFDIWDLPDSTIWLLDTHDWILREIDLGEYSYAFWRSPNQLLVGINRTAEEHLFNVETGEISPVPADRECLACIPFMQGSRITAYDLELSIVNGELDVIIDTTAYLSTAFEPNTDLQPWSPDGQSFLFITELQGQSDIYLSMAEGGIARRLTNTPSPEQMPNWSPDGQKISFVAYDEGNPEIYVLDLTTGYRYNLSRSEGRDYDPLWQSVP